MSDGKGDRDAPLSFQTVLSEELACLRKRQEHLREEEKKHAPAGEEQQAQGTSAHSSAEQEALSLDLAGLALSGGGIRSATFNLGILQGLAHLGLLRRFDYLSTVSGGGYIGAWLAAWIKREGKPLEVEKQLKPSREQQAEARRLLARGLVVEEEPEPIHHLRSYSNYLSPRLGLFSIDTWTLVSIYLRNLLLNLAVLVPSVLACALLARLFLWLYYQPWNSWGVTLFVGVVAAGLLLRAFVNLAGTLRRQLRGDHSRKTPSSNGGASAPSGNPCPSAGDQSQKKPSAVARLLAVFVNRVRTLRRQLRGGQSREGLSPDPTALDGLGSAQLLSPRLRVARKLILQVFLPLLAAAFLISWLFRARFDGTPSETSASWVLSFPFTAILFGIVCGGALGVARLVMGLLREHALRQIARGGRACGSQADPTAAASALPRKKRISMLCTMLYSFVSGFTAGFLFYAIFAAAIWNEPDERRPALVLTVGPPLVLALFLLGIILEIGLHGRDLKEDAREWWGTVGGYLLIYTLAWLAFFLITLYSTPVLQWLNGVLTTALTATWLTTAIAGALSGRSGRTKTGKGNRWLEWLGIIAPLVFVVGLLVAVSALAGVLVEGDGNNYWEQTRNTRVGAIVIALVVCVALVWAVGMHVDVNLFSLHGTYANRLIRCYLGASRRKLHWHERDGEAQRSGVPAQLGPPERLIHSWLPGRGGAPTGNDEPTARQADLITGFDPDDDILLSDLVIGKDHPGKKPYWGPFLIINTALNLVTGDELAWQERKAASFTLTALTGGSKTTGYQRLPPYDVNNPDDSCDLTLGRAMAISGAAASPNMGYHSSPLLAFLMTVFNVRLGWWMQNPRWSGWRASSPMRANLIAHELLGQTNEDGKYVYLSDGGHFDNLGGYELVRRRCRFIVLCDADADPSYEFFDLGDMIRKVRDDFGIRIDIDISAIKAQARRSRWHCAVGTIRYDDIDLTALPGILVYLKASLTGDEASDVLAYADQHARFPHESTVDQFFTESQFESYRALGFHIAQETFGDGMKIPYIKAKHTQPGTYPERTNQQIFSRLRRRWFPPPPDLEPHFLESVKGFVAVHQSLRRDPSLWGLTRDLFPELSSLFSSDGEPNGAATAPIAQPAAVPPAAVTPPDERPAGNGGPAAAPPDGVNRFGAELHVVSQMLQVMENAWLSLKLGQYHEHPLNRGWMTVFRRWTNSEAFSRYWPSLRGEYSQEFVQFCEKELKLVLWDIRADRVTDIAAEHRDLEMLDKEFAFDWYREDQDGRGLLDLVERAGKLGQLLKKDPFIWIIRVTNASKEDDNAGLGKGNIGYACGIILLFPSQTSVPDDKLEFFVWIVGPYRNQGIGRDPDCVASALETIWSEVSQGWTSRPFQLFVRYPQEESADGEELVERALWLSFFHYYGFHRTKSEDFGRKQDLILACRSDQWRQRRQARQLQVL